jgi:arylsulfatase A-like enzyme
VPGKHREADSPIAQIDANNELSVPSSYRKFVRSLSITGLVNASGGPNILFIAMDDLNDWNEPLGGHPQAITPNLKRLADSGVLFNNAHCPAPACNPSRSAIFTGRSPHVSGMYSNRQKMREIMPDAELLPKYFSNHGYWSGGSGKMLHYFIDADSWDEYYPAKETENPFPGHMPWGERPKSLPRGGPWQYVETDWHAFDVTDDEFGGDSKVADYVSGKLMEKQDKPFFLACGIYRPHEPWFVPKKYFDMFPLEDVQLPPGYLEDDLDDLPPAGKKAGPNRYFAHIRDHGQWRQGVQAYLASIAYADAMLGRVLDALEKSPNRDNTIVVLWSDHGWHLGEKQHWQKYTMWRAVTRIPFIIKVPSGAVGLPLGTSAGSVCSRPVNLLSLFPTLVELCGLPEKSENDGLSLVPLLRNPSSDWPHVSITHGGEPGTFGLSAEDWRYIHYANGDEEMYDVAADPYEWTNLAAMPEYQAKLNELRALAPKVFAPYVAATPSSLTPLVWHPASEGPAPGSKRDGGTFDIFFFNERSQGVLLFKMDSVGEPQVFGEIAAGAQNKQSSGPGEVWQIRDLSNGILGHFLVDDRSARAMIPSD